MKFKEEAITVITDFQSNLPLIVADGEKLGQAFINILLNAMEASTQSSTIEISSTIDSTGSEGVKNIIADEGYGVSEEQFPEIFKPFYTSELFGHQKGAFTGADHDKPGKIELAGAGTLFLDEIGELSLNLQGKFLGFLERLEYMPVGGQNILKSRCRIIAATNRDLVEMVQQKLF